MKQKISFGIGFISGRPNVCEIINNYEYFIKKQVEELEIDVDITIFILYDLNYANTKRTDFYNILPEVYKNVKIKYITPEDVLEYQKILISKYNISRESAELFIGKGYAKARNTILYCALERGIDYILFWDDDEYPVANVIQDDHILWLKQKNVLQHIKHMENADITYGYRCGMMSPIPYIQYTEDITKQDFKCFIDGVENEAITWKEVQEMRKCDNCISCADLKIAKGEEKPQYMENIGKDNWVLGSGICLNLNNLDKIPAFYNPPEARGDDAFFSCSLGTKNAKVLRISTYHFHDSFLQFCEIMKEKYPKKLTKAKLGNVEIEQRFLKTTIGWIRYKPLLNFIMDRKNYENIIEKAEENLKKSIEKMNTAFSTCNFSSLLTELEKYHKDVEKHYQEYLKVNEIWDELKYKIK